ncbi:MAG: mechanosensitive ion channel family protein [Planctomycetes bacterium]|nr:mechanosensitive ion channel family protein [Planctomycetota bacterium]
MSRFALAFTAALALVLPTSAQDPAATTTGNPSVSKAELELRLDPLQLGQVEVEAKAWLDLLAAKNAEISELRIAALGTGGNAAITAAVGEQAELVGRLELVLEAMRERGGDVAPYEKYVSASTGFELDTGNALAMATMAKDWLFADDGGIELGLNVLKFLAVLIAFRILSRILGGIAQQAMSRARGTSDLLRDFFVNATRKVTFFIGVIIAVSMIGVDIGPILAAMGAAGFVIGFALQGTLSNFAAGLMILIYQPYDIGQVVTVAGTTGKVDAMSLVSTTLRLPDNQTVVVPNSSIWGDVITNTTGQRTRRVDMMFGCGYGDDLQRVQQVLEEIVGRHPKVHAEPAPLVKVHALAASSVDFVVRPWTDTADYWDVFWDVTREVKERFDREGISIPFPQRDVHVHQVGA